MMKRGNIAWAALLGWAVLGTAQADGYEPGSTHPTLDLGAYVGGDKLATENAIIGGHNTLYAGNSLAFDFGVLHNLAETDWSLKATAGIQEGFIPTHTSSPTFTRYPLDLLFIYNQDRWHFGLGLTYHANPKLIQQDDVGDTAFHDAVGGVLLVQYRIFGFRYTNIRYRSADACPGRCSYDGSTLGLYLDFVF